MKHLLITTIAAVLLVGCGLGEPSEKDLGLINSARIGDIGAVKKYLANGANINARNELGETSLHAAAFNKRINIIQLLLDNGAEINSEDNNGYTPMDMARGEVSVLLGKHGGKENYRTDPITEAAQPESPTTKAPDISIHKAATDGNIETVKQHIASGADLNAKNKYAWTPLHLAAINGQREVVELLIAKAADLNARDNSGYTPLHVAVINGQKEIATLLISKGTDVNAKDIAGSTPLFNAVLRSSKEIAELLIAKGADANVKDDSGTTPLHCAADRGYKEIAELLITEGADVNVKDFYGTPLDWAIDFKRTETADLLRKHGGKTAAELKAEGK